MDLLRRFEYGAVLRLSLLQAAGEMDGRVPVVIAPGHLQGARAAPQIGQLLPQRIFLLLLLLLFLLLPQTLLLLLLPQLFRTPQLLLLQAPVFLRPLMLFLFAPLPLLLLLLGILRALGQELFLLIEFVPEPLFLCGALLFGKRLQQLLDAFPLLFPAHLPRMDHLFAPDLFDLLVDGALADDEEIADVVQLLLEAGVSGLVGGEVFVPQLGMIRQRLLQEIAVRDAAGGLLQEGIEAVYGLQTPCNLVSGGAEVDLAGDGNHGVPHLPEVLRLLRVLGFQLLRSGVHSPGQVIQSGLDSPPVFSPVEEFVAFCVVFSVSQRHGSSFPFFSGCSGMTRSKARHSARSGSASCPYSCARSSALRSRPSISLPSGKSFFRPSTLVSLSASFSTAGSLMYF